VTSGGPLVVGAALTDLDAVVIDGNRIATDSGCALAAGKVKASKKGTIVRGKWSLCGTAKRVRLKGVIASPACDTMNGKVRAKRRPATTFQAVRSRCGDGRFDMVGGEGCDGTGCSTGQTCAACTCVAAPTTTTLPGGVRAVCGDGIVAADELCDLMALPSGCPAGQYCDVGGAGCVCAPIPDTIGRQVSFDPGTPPDPATFGLPQLGNGTYLFMSAPGVDLAIDPTLSDPIVAVGRCASWIAKCLAPPDRLLDDCARSAPVCQTDQPWLEPGRCCPSGCFTAYEAERQAGASPLLAMRRVYFTDVSCFPGARAMLGLP
jgi:hypothetical protein